MNEWITRVEPIEARPGPLHGLTMALKDNIDLAGVPTTAGDPRNTEPATHNAFVVDRLVAAGAVPLGKTNLDQYATGLVGTRSPYGACHSVYSAEHVSGGSSSGSAVAVASGQVDFALGTDTAGQWPGAGCLQSDCRHQTESRDRLRARRRTGVPVARLRDGDGPVGGHCAPRLRRDGCLRPGRRVVAASPSRCRTAGRAECLGPRR